MPSSRILWLYVDGCTHACMRVDIAEIYETLDDWMLTTKYRLKLSETSNSVNLSNFVPLQRAAG